MGTLWERSETNDLGWSWGRVTALSEWVGLTPHSLRLIVSDVNRRRDLLNKFEGDAAGQPEAAPQTSS